MSDVASHKINQQSNHAARPQPTLNFQSTSKQHHTYSQTQTYNTWLKKYKIPSNYPVYHQGYHWQWQVRRPPTNICCFKINFTLFCWHCTGSAARTCHRCKFTLMMPQNLHCFQPFWLFRLPRIQSVQTKFTYLLIHFNLSSCK